MIRHVVTFQLTATDPDRRAEHVREVRDRLHALRDVSEGIVSLEVFTDLGETSSHWPLVLIADYVDAQALQAYQNHPRHREVVAWMNSGIVSDRTVVDFAPS